MTVKIGKSGKYSDWRILESALVGTPVHFSNSNGTFHGETGRVFSTGWLSTEWAVQYRATDVAYTVMSYGTPIGWRSAAGDWTVPNEGFSRTTTGHQSKLRVALHTVGYFFAVGSDEKGPTSVHRPGPTARVLAARVEVERLSRMVDTRVRAPGGNPETFSWLGETVS